MKIKNEKCFESVLQTLETLMESEIAFAVKCDLKRTQNNEKK